MARLTILMFLILGFFMSPVVAADVTETKLEIPYPDDDGHLTDVWKEIYQAYQAHDCDQVSRIFRKNIVGDSLFDPELIGWKSYFLEKGLCFSVDEKHAFKLAAENKRWILLRLRYAFLTEFGIGIEENPEVALANYVFFLQQLPTSSNIEFMKYFIANDLVIFLSGNVNTPLLEKALLLNSKLESSAKDRSEYIRKLMENPDTKEELEGFLQLYPDF